MSEVMLHEIGTRIRDNELLSLTDMWKSQGSKPTKHPSKWLMNESTEEFVQALAKKKEVKKSSVLMISRGYAGGTWAHWQIALAYAKWLSPELHMKANEVVRSYIEADANMIHDMVSRNENTEELEEISAHAAARAKTIESNKLLNSAIFKLGGNGPTCGKVANINNVNVIGMKAHEIREVRGVKNKRTRDSFTYPELVSMAFIEHANLMALEAKKPQGHNQIVAEVETVGQKYQQFMQSICN